MNDAALDLMAGLVLEDGRRWGEVAAEWQWEDAGAILDPDAETPFHYLTRPRGGSKTSDLAGFALVAMLTQLPARSRLYALAADRDQGRLLLDALAGFAARTPELGGALDIGSYRVTAARTGSTLDVLAADAPGAWGLRPAFVIADEVAQWATTAAPRLLFEAVTSAVAKVRGARLAIITTPSSPTHWSYRVLEHARGDPLWRTHELKGPPPWLDRARLDEQRRRLPEASYRRLFGGEWVAAEDQLVSPDDLTAAVVLDGPLSPEPGRRYSIGVDLGVKRDASVVAVCHGEPVERIPEGEVEPIRTGTRVVLDRIAAWEPTRSNPVTLDTVEQWIIEAAARYSPSRVVYDSWQALGMTQRLRQRGVQVVEFVFSPANVGRLATNLHMLLRNRLLALPRDEALLEELGRVHLRETSPGTYRVDHDADAHDDRVIALGLAALDLVDRRPPATRAPTMGGAPDLATALLYDGPLSAETVF